MYFAYTHQVEHFSCTKLAIFQQILAFQPTPSIPCRPGSLHTHNWSIHTNLWCIFCMCTSLPAKFQLLSGSFKHLPAFAGSVFRKLCISGGDADFCSFHTHFQHCFSRVNFGIVLLFRSLCTSREQAVRNSRFMFSSLF